MNWRIISDCRSELNEMVESHFDNGSLSEPEFVNKILMIEKKLETLHFCPAN